MNNNFLEGIKKVTGEAINTGTTMLNNATKVATENVNLGNGLTSVISNTTNLLNINNIASVSSNTIGNLANAASGFLSSNSANLNQASRNLFDGLANTGIIDKSVANAWSNQVAAYSKNATDVFSSIASGSTTNYHSAVEKITGVMGNYNETVKGLTENLKNTMGISATKEDLLSGKVSAAELVPSLLASSKDLLATAIHLPSFSIDKIHSSVNEGYDTLLKYKNKVLGIDKTGNHKGDVITTLGDSVLSGWLLDDYNKKLNNGTNVVEGVVALQNIKNSGPTLLAQALGGKVNQMQYPGIRTDELRYVLDENFRNSPFNWTVSDERKAFLDAHRAEYLKNIDGSDTIVLDIGWNNINTPIAVFNEVGNFWGKAFSNDEGLPLDQKIMQVAADTPDFLGKMVTGIERSVGSYVIDYPILMQEIYKRNPNATLVITGGYNPGEDVDLSSFLGLPIDDDITSAFCESLYDLTAEPYKKALCLLYPGEAVYADMSGVQTRVNGPYDVFTGGLDFHPTQAGAIEQANKLATALGHNSGLKLQDVRTNDNTAIETYLGNVIDATNKAAKDIFTNNNK